MLRKVFSYLILTNQIDIAEPYIYHHLVFLQEFGGLLGGCLTVKNEWWLLTQKMIKPLYLF